jgi:hypothetical protein
MEAKEDHSMNIIGFVIVAIMVAMFMYYIVTKFGDAF